MIRQIFDHKNKKTYKKKQANWMSSNELYKPRQTPKSYMYTFIKDTSFVIIAFIVIRMLDTYIIKILHSFIYKRNVHVLIKLLFRSI